MTTAAPPKLLADDIVHHFATPRGPLLALDHFGLSVADNEFATLVGTSGCGKSTFLHIVAGLTEPTEGRVFIDGHRVTRPGRDRGMVFQSYTLFPWLTVRANVEFALKKSALSRSEKQELVEHYLNMVGLRGFEDSYPRQLSGGMQQRVAIARALVYHPAVLLMDEPFGALDAQTRGLMQELLLNVWEQSRCTVVFVTHDVDEAIFMSDHVYIMTARPGRIKCRVPIELPRPRTYELMMTAEFTAIKREIVAAIREETLKVMTLA
jgi:ABC-type nitrate/sulfonate/bicarbonate transport system ATPase subunit